MECYPCSEKESHNKNQNEKIEKNSSSQTNIGYLKTPRCSLINKTNLFIINEDDEFDAGFIDFTKSHEFDLTQNDDCEITLQKELSLEA